MCVLCIVAVIVVVVIVVIFLPTYVLFLKVVYSKVIPAPLCDDLNLKKG